MPSSRHVGRISASTSRVHNEYSVCSAVIGCVACARRIVSGAASLRPMWRTLPSFTSSPIAPTVSSIGRLKSTRCRYQRSTWSVPSRFSEPSSARRAFSADPSSTRLVGSSFVGSKRMPNLVAITQSSRRPEIALPTSSSFLYGPYISAVSRKLQPSSRARSIVASASPSFVVP